MFRRVLLIAVLVGLVLLALIQLVPYGRAHTNPPVAAEPQWDSPQTLALFDRACADCHSNETVWPWYSHVAPASWLVQRDVDLAREEFNVSEWGRRGNSGERAAGLVERGEMPPFQFLLLHPEARLSAEEKQGLIQGLTNTFGRRG